MITFLYAFFAEMDNLYATGSNKYGKLGCGKNYEDQPSVAQFTSLNRSTDGSLHQVHLGHNHAFVTDENYQLYGWGSNQHNQLGLDSEMAIINLPKLIPYFDINGNAIKYADAGTNISVALDVHGNVWTWGQQQNGSLGRECEGEDNQTPGKINTDNIDFDEEILQTYILHQTTILLTNKSKLMLFGPCSGFCGTESTKDAFYSVATQINTNFDFKIKQFWIGMKTLWMLDDKDTLHAMGNNSHGQLCIGKQSNWEKQPVSLNISGSIEKIESSYTHTLIQANETVYGCGNNTYNSLGNLNKNVITIPTKLNGNIDGKVVSVAVTRTGSFILTTKGLFASGKQECGELSYGNNTIQQTKFTKINFAKNITHINHIIAHTDYAFMYTQQEQTEMLKKWQIIGIVLGVVVGFIALIIILVFSIKYCQKKCKNDKSYYNIKQSTPLIPE